MITISDVSEVAPEVTVIKKDEGVKTTKAGKPNMITNFLAK